MHDARETCFGGVLLQINVAKNAAKEPIALHGGHGGPTTIPSKRSQLLKSASNKSPSIGPSLPGDIGHDWELTRVDMVRKRVKRSHIHS